jgi:hypothetical protein
LKETLQSSDCLAFFGLQPLESQRLKERFFMASPFSIFRKNQRLWMAGAVLIAVLSFVVAPMLQSFSGYGPTTVRGGEAKQIAASWSGGSITNEQIENELVQLSIANTFLRKLAVDVREKGGFPQVPEVRPDLAIVGISQESRDPAIIVQRKLMAAEAKRLGIHFDDQSVKTFLQKFVNGKISGEQIQKTLKEVSGGRMNLMDFNRLMREELAKNAMLRLANTSQRFEERVNAQGLPTTVLSPPSKNWQYFTRFNRSASIEAFPVFVKDFETAVTGTPTDRELRALFDQGKEISRIDMPILTEPAFMTPSMADFEFIACDVDKIINEEMAKIPEDVLRAEYDRRVQQNQYRVPAPATPNPAAIVPGPATETEPANPGTPAAPGEPGATPPSNLPPTLENPVENPNDNPSDNPSGSTTENPPTAPVNVDGKGDGSSQSNLNPRSGDPQAVKLVSFQDTPVQDTPVQEIPVQEAPVLQPATIPETPAETPTVPAAESATQPPTSGVPATAEPPATEPSPAGVPTTGEATAPVLTLQDTPPNTTPANPEPASSKPNEPPMRIQSFEEVREAIARETAAGEAFRTLDRRAAEIRDLMEIYSVNRRAYERAVAEKDKTAVAPEPLNLQSIADQYGFQYSRTGLVDMRTASTLPIGRSRVTRGIRMNPFEFLQLIRIAPDPYESDNIGNTYVPLTSSAMLTRFIFWKVDHKSAETPSYESAKDAVRAVWQTQQAAALAEAKAKEIASRVGASTLEQSLESETDRNLLLRPTPFTWLNAMVANFDIQLSNVDGLKPIGNDFMERVFSATPGETIVAPDITKELYYVVKVNSYAPNEEDLLSRFSAAPTTTGVQNAANLDTARTLPSWFSNLQKQLGYQGR